jgi:uncharacterized protein involved in tolerance to divalent cations
MRGLRSILGVAVVVALIFACFKVLPVYISAYEFEDAIKEEAKLSAYSNRTEDQIHDTILKKANELELPVDPDHIVVHHIGNDVTISVDYSVHVDLPNFPIVLKFHPETSGHRMPAVA